MVDIDKRVNNIVERAKAYLNNTTPVKEPFEEILERCLYALETSSIPYFAYIAIPHELFQRTQRSPEVICWRLEFLFQNKIMVNYSTDNGGLELALRVKISP